MAFRGNTQEFMAVVQVREFCEYRGGCKKYSPNHNLPFWSLNMCFVWRCMWHVLCPHLLSIHTLDIQTTAVTTCAENLEMWGTWLRVGGTVVRSFVCVLLRAGVQPTLDPSAETFMSVQCASPGRGGELVGVCGVCASCVGWRKG